MTETSKPQKSGRQKYREQLADWLSGGSSNTRTLSDAEQVLAAWKAGAMPQTPEELLQWAVALDKGAKRAERQRKALLGLLGIVAAKTTSDGGTSYRALGRALGCSSSRIQDLVEAGRETLALPRDEAPAQRQKRGPKKCGTCDGAGGTAAGLCPVCGGIGLDA